MKRTWMILMTAVMLTASLTSCGWNDTGVTTENNALNDVQQTTPNNSVTNEEMENEIQGDTRTVKRTSSTPRTAHDYLQDGVYRADGNGKVDGTGSPSMSLDGKTKALVRNGKDAIRKAGDDVGQMTQDAANSVKRATDEIGKVARDVME